MTVEANNSPPMYHRRRRMGRGDPVRPRRLLTSGGRKPRSGPAGPSSLIGRMTAAAGCRAWRPDQATEKDLPEARGRVGAKPNILVEMEHLDAGPVDAALPRQDGQKV